MQRVKKSEIITLRVTPRIKRIIQEQAKAAGLTVTDYLCYSGLGKKSCGWTGWSRCSLN